MQKDASAAVYSLATDILQRGYLDELHAERLYHLFIYLPG